MYLMSCSLSDDLKNEYLKNELSLLFRCAKIVLYSIAEKQTKLCFSGHGMCDWWLEYQT